MKTTKTKHKLIETDAFPFEFLSQLAERESWRKEIHRPVYHVHKWWAKRLGSVFRGILLGCALPSDSNLEDAFYQIHENKHLTVLDPFMGSGTTIGEAHKLGFSAYGRDINPVAVNAVRVALGPVDVVRVEEAFIHLSKTVGEEIRSLYRSTDSFGLPCDILYHFWVMQAECPQCRSSVDLFSSYVFARNAYPNKKPEVQIICPTCRGIFQGKHGERSTQCPSCSTIFDPESGPAKGSKASCSACDHKDFGIIAAIGRRRPQFRLYAKLVLRVDGEKQYLPASIADIEAYVACSERLKAEEEKGTIALPSLLLENGHNTKQAISYGFTSWRDFFNDRQLLALGLLRSEIEKIDDEPTRAALMTLFSGALEFNNMFASYKGEGTGAVRHMFAHHILKPERTPIEANIWGTPKSSGSFASLFRSRLLRAFSYRQAPTEVNGTGTDKGRVCSPPFTGRLETWESRGVTDARIIRLSCGDSSKTGLPDKSIDLVVTDPPFFDNVHYSELADFFYAWQQLGANGQGKTVNTDTTRNRFEVQDADAKSFSLKLGNVFAECHRVLSDEGLLTFTYHHSSDEGWTSLAEAIIGAGFIVMNSHPVKAEMSVATPKSQAKHPIQLDIVIVCRKAGTPNDSGSPTMTDVISSGTCKLQRLADKGFKLSSNDQKIVLYGQLLTLVRTLADAKQIASLMDSLSTSVTFDRIETRDFGLTKSNTATI